MATIVFGTYMVQYPLGGMLSNCLEYIVGFHRLGHEVVVVERALHAAACFDPRRNIMTDDPRYGTGAVADLLGRFGVSAWCYVGPDGEHYGLDAAELRSVFARADLFVDYGAHGMWSEEAAAVPVHVLIDGEPGYRQIADELGVNPRRQAVTYDFHYTNGMNVGTPASAAPTGGFTWRHLFHPVNPAVHEHAPAPRQRDLFTTVMNWQSHSTIEFRGQTFGQKDVEFAKFVDLPRRVRSDARLEIAVAGDVPRQTLDDHGWAVRSAHDVTRTYDSFLDYVDDSAGEFTVCKNVFVALRTGWFSDRSAVYLARGRPVVMQDTGFSEHLPTGEGLFAVESVDAAADAVDQIVTDYERHGAAARDIAREYLAADRVLGRLLQEVGVA
jgi:hypothetical protein